jgi:acetyltransferase-like isoleucine patch superfamily enzyme
MLFADSREGGAGITIEDDVMLGSGVHLYVSNHKFENPYLPIIDQGHMESKAIVIKRGSWIGANCILLPGVTVGKNSVVGAGCVITKSLPDGVMAVGNPAKVIKKIGLSGGSEIT